MTVTVDGNQLYDWPVSTGGGGYDTPIGSFKPFRMEIDHRSEETTLRRIRSFSPRSATPFTALTSNAIWAVQCRMAAFGCR
jgi:hypothetical protein